MTQKEVDQKSEQNQADLVEKPHLSREVASRGWCDLNTDTVKAPGFQKQRRPGGAYDS